MIMNNIIYWIWMILLFVIFAFYNLSPSQARPISSHHHPIAVVVGTVFCDANCYQQDLSKASHFITGAIVAVECPKSGKSSRFYRELKTNEHGEFRVHLPFLVDKHVKHIIGCSVKLINSSDPHCGVASTKASSSFRLQSRKKGTHIFSSGFFTFKPVNKQQLCNQKPNIHSTKKKETYSHKSLTLTPTFSPQPLSSFLTIKQEFLPPLPSLPPLPQLPPLPPLPSLPPLILFPPFFHSPPMSPPPSIFPPIIRSPPTPPPPSIFPPFFHSPPMSPPPSIFPPIIPPPIIGLTPPPPPPTFPFPLLPFPFRPMPGFPGVPPSSSSFPNKKNSP